MDPYTRNCVWKSVVDNNLIIRTFEDEYGTVFTKSIHNRQTRIIECWSYYSANPAQLKSYSYTSNNAPAVTVSVHISKTNQVNKIRIYFVRNNRRVNIRVNHIAQVVRVVESANSGINHAVSPPNAQLYTQISELSVPFTESDFSFLKMLLL